MDNSQIETILQEFGKRVPPSSQILLIGRGRQCGNYSPLWGDLKVCFAKELRPFFGRALMPPLLDEAFRGELSGGNNG